MKKQHLLWSLLTSVFILGFTTKTHAYIISTNLMQKENNFILLVGDRHTYGNGSPEEQEKERTSISSFFKFIDLLNSQKISKLIHVLVEASGDLEITAEIQKKADFINNLGYRTVIHSGNGPVSFHNIDSRPGSLRDLADIALYSPSLLTLLSTHSEGGEIADWKFDWAMDKIDQENPNQASVQQLRIDLISYVKRIKARKEASSVDSPEFLIFQRLEENLLQLSVTLLDELDPQGSPTLGGDKLLPISTIGREYFALFKKYQWSPTTMLEQAVRATPGVLMVAGDFEFLSQLFENIRNDIHSIFVGGHRHVLNLTPELEKIGYRKIFGTDTSPALSRFLEINDQDSLWSEVIKHFLPQGAHFDL
jgi:hypothetical protein